MNKIISYLKFKQNILSKKRKKRLQKKIIKNLRSLYCDYVLKRDSSLSAHFRAIYGPPLEEMDYNGDMLYKSLDKTSFGYNVPIPLNLENVKDY